MSHPKIQVEDEESRLVEKYLQKTPEKLICHHHQSSPKDDEMKKQAEESEILKIKNLTKLLNFKLKIMPSHPKIQSEDEENRLAIKFLCKRTKKFNWGYHQSSPKDDEIEKQNEKSKIKNLKNSRREIIPSHPKIQSEDEENRLAIKFLCKRTKKFNWGRHDDNVEQNESPKISRTKKLNENILLKLKETKKSNLRLKISNWDFLFKKIITT